MIGDWGHLLTESIKPTINGMYQNLRLCISTQHVKELDESIKVMVDGLGHWVRIKEAVNCLDTNKITWVNRMESRHPNQNSNFEDLSSLNLDTESNHGDHISQGNGTKDDEEIGTLSKDKSRMNTEVQQQNQSIDPDEGDEEIEHISLNLEARNQDESGGISAMWKVRDNDHITTSESKNTYSVEIIEKASSISSEENIARIDAHVLKKETVRSHTL